MIWLILYGLVAAAVFGWLLRAHLTADHSSAGVPWHVLLGLPLSWLPVLAIFVILVVGCDRLLLDPEGRMVVRLLMRLGLSARAAKPVAIALIGLAIVGVFGAAIALVYRSGSAAGGAKVTTKVEKQRAEHAAQARTDERKATAVTIAIAERAARADALSETLLRTTIQDLRDALDSTPPATAGAAPPVVPVDRLHDDLNQAIARANGSARPPAAP